MRVLVVVAVTAMTMVSVSVCVFWMLQARAKPMLALQVRSERVIKANNTVLRMHFIVFAVTDLTLKNKNNSERHDLHVVIVIFDGVTLSVVPLQRIAGQKVEVRLHQLAKQLEIQEVLLLLLLLQRNRFDELFGQLLEVEHEENGRQGGEDPPWLQLDSLSATLNMPTVLLRQRLLRRRLLLEDIDELSHVWTPCILLVEREFILFFQRF